VFCCDPPGGEPLFPLVPLDRIFKNPPIGDTIDTKFDLNVDNTWGDGVEDTLGGDNPSDAAVSFYLMASNEEIQTSLDKRDGSHWELFNCNDAASEEEQTIQMFCTDVSAKSNCGHISRGDGVPGTIIEMPKGCGPGKYAVAKTMVPSENQTLPHHLYKRNYGHKPVVYDLTFDYRFERVPRRFGPTQLRVDYSNQVGYWDNIVAKAAGTKKKKKRSLEAMGGNHKRWLEEEFRDDMHFGGPSKEELHKRWFGEDIVSWLRGLLNGGIKPTFRHYYTDEISAIILQEDWECQLNEAIATTSVRIATSFGLTIVTTLNEGGFLDLSNSFLHFNNEGEITATFTLDAIAKVDFDSKPFNLTKVPLPGAGFRVPGVMTIGPEFILDAQVKAGIAISGHVEAKVEIASWEIRQTYTEQTDEFKPQELDSPSKNLDVSGLKQPEFDASVQATGYMEAHIMPTLSFGIDVDKEWRVGKCTAELVADGWVRMRAKSDIVSGDCGFAYAVDAGAGLVGKATVPDAFHWEPETLSFGSISRTRIPNNGDEWKCLTNEGTGRRRDINTTGYGLIEGTEPVILKKRLTTYGPVFRLPKAGCPTKGGSAETVDCRLIFGVDGTDEPDGDNMKRDLFSKGPDFARGTRSEDEPHLLEERQVKKITACSGNGAQTIFYPDYPDAIIIYDNADWADCNNYLFGVQAVEQPVERPPGSLTPTERYIAEHVLEAQMLKMFMDANYRQPGNTNSVCSQMSRYWNRGNVPIAGQPQNPWVYVAKAYPGDGRNEGELMRIIEVLNLVKERLTSFQGFKGTTITAASKLTNAVASEQTVHSAIRNMKNALMVYKYMAMLAIRTIYRDQARRVEVHFATAEAAIQANDPTYTPHGLQAAWLAWATGHTTVTISRFDTFSNTWVPQIENVLANTVPANDDPGRAALRVKITTLRAEVNAVIGTWTNPLP
ncbi:hypothetical protein B0O99DRAFT_505946, partial [Bisporella sp. PMI_857]